MVEAKYTVDASVLLKLVIEEEYSLHAKKLALEFADSKVMLNAPSIVDYELGSVLYKMVRDKIIESKYAEEAFRRLLKLPIVKVAPADLVAVLGISSNLGIHYYDCLYILAAKESKSALISSDQKLVNAAKKVLPADASAVHLKDIRWQ